MAVTISGADWGDGRLICPPMVDSNGNIYLCCVDSSNASQLKMTKPSNDGA